MALSIAIGNRIGRRRFNWIHFWSISTPSNVVLTVLSDTSIRVNFDNPGTVDGHSIERSTDNINWSVVGNVSFAVRTFTDAGLSGGILYYYRVRGYKGSRYSAYTTTASTTTSLTAPSALGLTVVSDTRIDLAWTDNSSGEDGFKIERSTDNITFVQIDTSAVTSYSDITCVQGTLYYYKVRGYHGAVNSAYCTVASATTYSYFTTTWQTENAGSATKTIVIPTAGAGYDCWVTWGDGSAEENFTGTAPAISHVYPTTGVKTVKIRGAFPRIYFNAGGDFLKLLTIANWGNGAWTSWERFMFGCANITGTYTDTADTHLVTDMSLAFRDCSLFNTSLGNINTSAVTTTLYMFYNSGFNQSVANFNISSLTTATGMFQFCTQSTANYDALLISWAAQTVKPNININFHSSKYSAGAAAAARLVLTSAPNNWVITDGGQV